MYKHDCIDSITASASRPTLNWRSWAALGMSLVKRDAAALMGLLLEWDRRARDRQVLRDMDGRMLDDIGISHKQLQREIAKPFWWL